MRPTPIPDAEVWEGAQRQVVAPPGGDLTNPLIAPVEALLDRAPAGGRTLSVRCILEDGDLAKLQAGGTVWITFWGAMVPWATTVVAPIEGTALPPIRLEQRTPYTAACPDKPHHHAWRRHRPELADGTDRRFGYFAAADGTTLITEEALTELLRLAGFVPEEQG